MFCIYIRTNSDLCHLQHKLTGFYNRDEKCLQRGTDWVFKYRSLRFVLEDYPSGLHKMSAAIHSFVGISLLNLVSTVTQITVSILDAGCSFPLRTEWPNWSTE